MPTAALNLENYMIRWCDLKEIQYKQKVNVITWELGLAIKVEKCYNIKSMYR